MLDDFRALGGTADNVEQRQGAVGNGLFPMDATLPVTIRVPDNLLIDDEMFVLVDGALVISPVADAPPAVREFYAMYQKHFSWGADGRAHVEAFESGLKGLPEPLRLRLRQLGLLNLAVRHEGAWDDVLRRRFLASRRINYKKRKVIMPIIELINHAPRSPGYQVKDGIGFQGTFADEVTVNYSATNDSLLRFLNYGFANQEPFAYSLPVTLKQNDDLTVVVGLNPDSMQPVNRLPTPKVEVEGHRRKISHLRLGVERAPRMPRTLLRNALPDVPVAVADEIFDRVRGTNILVLAELLELADGADGPVGREFRRALLFQLKALSYCFGVRPDGATPAA
jgi:hypothetical protein